MFQLPDYTYATIASFTPRVEKHGDEEVPAISISFRITTSNTILDKLSDTLRKTLYTKPEGQEDLPGVEESTPLLRTRGIEKVELNGKFEGWTLEVDYGLDEEAPITCGGCKVDNFVVFPKEGGTVDLQFRVGTSDVSPGQAGILWSKNHQEVSIRVRAPEKAPDVIDASSTGDWPFPQEGEPDGQQSLDATDAFVDAHAEA